MQVDLVYLYVDANDEKWQEEKNFWAKKNGFSNATNICRFVDNQELKYSLRSVEKNIPWINHIYIITNGQIPNWLNTNNSKISIITHDQIMPKECLPTFNSEAIETCITNIPNLSEHFIYANDDFFVNKPLEKTYFFNKDGKPILRMVEENYSKKDVKKSLYLHNVKFAQTLIKEKFGNEYNYQTSHNMDAYRKSYIKECLCEFSDVQAFTLKNRFRAANSLQRTIFSYYMLATKNAVLKLSKIKHFDKPKDALYVPLRSTTFVHEQIKKNDPSLFCINDDENTSTDDRLYLQNLLMSLFDKASEFEIMINQQIDPAFSEANSYTIVFAPDNKYCKYFSVALKSLIAHSKENNNYDILVFNNDISLENQRLLSTMIPKNFSLRFVNVDPYIYSEFGSLNLRSQRYWSISMYYRIFIPIILKKHPIVLYADSDICFNNSVEDLFNIKFDGKKILAVVDSVSTVLYKENTRKLFIQNKLELDDPEKYFNSGIILFNNSAIKTQEYKTKIMQSLSIENLLYPDQDMLNFIFKDQVKLLPMKWNYLYGGCAHNSNYPNLVSQKFQKDFALARKRPFIIHYTSPRKPWNYLGTEYSNVFWHFAKQTPYYEEILFEYIQQAENSQSSNKKTTAKQISVCKIPVIKIKKEDCSLRVSLLNIIPILKISYKKYSVLVKLFNCIPILKIRNS